MKPVRVIFVDIPCSTCRVPVRRARSRVIPGAPVYCSLLCAERAS